MIGAGFVILLVFIPYFALARSAGIAVRKMEEIFRLSTEGEAGGLDGLANLYPPWLYSLLWGSRV